MTQFGFWAPSSISNHFRDSAESQLCSVYSLCSHPKYSVTPFSYDGSWMMLLLSTDLFAISSQGLDSSVEIYSSINCQFPCSLTWYCPGWLITPRFYMGFLLGLQICWLIHSYVHCWYKDHCIESGWEALDFLITYTKKISLGWEFITLLILRKGVQVFALVSLMILG